MIKNMFGEVRRVYALTLQPPLQVGEGDDDGIDIALVDPPAIMAAKAK